MEKTKSNIVYALKRKNRLAGEIAQQQAILKRENSRRNDSVSKIDRVAVWNNIIKLSEDLMDIKGRIAKANIEIYPALERMSELKSLIGFLKTLPTREGAEMVTYGETTHSYNWESTINQEKADALISQFQEEINDLQDLVDAFNASTVLLYEQRDNPNLVS